MINNYGLTDKGNSLLEALRGLVTAVAKLEKHSGKELGCGVSQELKLASQAIVMTMEPIQVYQKDALNVSAVNKVLKILSKDDIINIEHLAHNIMREKQLYDTASLAWIEASLIIVNNLGRLK